MQSFNIALEAAQRWGARQQVRDLNGSRLAAGGAAAVEAPERVQLRLERLSRAATGERGTLAVIDAPPPLRAGRVLPTLVETVGVERVLGKADFMGVSFLGLALAVSRFVGRVSISLSPGQTVGHGTGFMVSPRLLMTNHHVLGSKKEAAFSQVEFDYQYDRFGRLLPVRTFGLLPGEFFLTSPELDFTLVAVREKSQDGVPIARYGWTRLIEAQGKALLGESLNIIQHPKGEVKQVVLRSNHLVDLFDDYAHYITDTEPGSSGSPVYNDQWELVALHHSGVPKSVDGNLIAKDGSVWKDGMDPEDLEWVANEGIRASSLVKFIKKARLANAEARRLRNELLTLEPPHPLEAAYLAAEAGEDGQPSTPEPAPGPDAPPAGSASFTWTIPIHISLEVGQPQPEPGTTAPETPQVTIKVTTGGGQPAPAPTEPQPPTPTEPQPPTPTEPEDPDHDIAIDQARKAPGRTYYDEALDLQARESYYQGIQPGATPQELYAQVSELVSRTHTKKNNYKPAVHLYPWVDLHERAGQPPVLRSIYSGIEFDPIELIEADFAVDRARRQLSEALRADPAFSAFREREQLDLLEASLPYNCEHVVPQSWFSKREPMRGDLHHLFACEADCNSFRGNIPYFDFPDFMEVERDQCGKRLELQFEPVANKGAVARATLYFLLRFPGQINRNSREYTEDRVATLVKWHRSNPVSRYEQHRNQAIFEMQGNRNPLIDHPEWGEFIDFVQGLGS